MKKETSDDRRYLIMPLLGHLSIDKYMKDMR